MNEFSRRQFLRASLAAALGLGLPSLNRIRANELNRTGSPFADNGLAIIKVPTSTRKVALTFDDLYDEAITRLIARYYARREIRVTFFPVGRAILKNLNNPEPGCENLYPRLLDMGHEIGCHLHTHRNPRGLTLEQLEDTEMAPALRSLWRALGRKFQPVALRPPFGIVTPELIQLARNHELPLVLWDVDTKDALCANRGSAAQCAKVVLRELAKRARPGSIILQHPIEASLRCLPDVLEVLTELELKPILLTSLLALRRA